MRMIVAGHIESRLLNIDIIHEISLVTSLQGLNYLASKKEVHVLAGLQWIFVE